MDNQNHLRHCFAILVENQPGVLARVVGLFSGRGYNIESLTVDKVDAKENLSRITVVSSGTPSTLDQISAQLGRLIPVRSVLDLTKEGRLVERGYALVKIFGNAQKRLKAATIARKAGAREVNETKNMAIFEISGTTKDLTKLVFSLRAAGDIEIARSGSVAIGCGEKQFSERATLSINH